MRSKIICSQTLQKTKRLRHSVEFRNFYNNSEVFRLYECTIYRVKNQLDHFRLGITLKARGSSVHRNRVKRLIREAFRTHAQYLGNYDYNVVIPQTKKLSPPYPEKLAARLKLELNRIFK